MIYIVAILGMLSILFGLACITGQRLRASEPQETLEQGR